MAIFELGIDFTSVGSSKMDAEMRRVGSTADKAEASINSLEASNRKLASSMSATTPQVRMATDSLRSHNGQMANLTAQWNDIGVMMAAGQSPIQLALQQGTQLNQVFAQMGGGRTALRAVATSLVSMINPLSIATIGVIALGAAAVQWFTSAGAAAKTLEDHSKDLTEALKAYIASQEMANFATGDAAAKYGLAAASASTYFASLEAGKLVTLNQRIKENGDALMGTLGVYDNADGIWAQAANAAEFFGQSNVFVGDKAKALRGEMHELISAMYTYRDATDLATRVDALQQVYDMSSKLADMDGRRSQQEIDFLDNIETQLDTLLVLRGRELDASMKSEVAARKGYASLRMQGEEMKRSAEGMIEAYQRQAQMGAAIAKYGKDSYQVEALRREEAMRTADAFIKQHQLSGATADAIRAAAGEAYEMNSGLSDSQRAMNAVASMAGTAAGAVGIATNQTYGWEAAASGVLAQIRGIASVLASIGGGLITSATMAVERQALAAGKSVAEARIEVEKFQVAAKYDGRIAGAEGRGGILGIAEAAALKTAKAVEMSNIKMAEQTGVMRDNALEAERAASRKGKAAGGAAAKVEKALDKEALAWRATLSPIEKYRQELAELEKLRSRLTQQEFDQAVHSLNMELADSLPLVGELSDAIGEFVASGFKDFSDLGDAFKNMLKQMVADAAKNQIMLWLQPQIAGGAGGAAGVPGQAGGSGGILTSLGSVFGKDSWLMTGLNSGQGVLGTIGGWLGAGAGGAGAAGGLMGSLGALGGLLGTAGAILGGIGMVISIGKKLFGRELKDTGISGTFSGSGFEGSSYKYYKGGLFRSDKTSYEALDPEVQGTIGLAYADLRKGVVQMANVLDLGTKAIKGFSYSFKISTKDMSEEEALEALQEEMRKAGDGMAELVLGTEKYSKAGESALDTMTRLSTSLAGFNDAMKLLDSNLRLAGLRGADIASNLIDLFGGLDQFSSAISNYWDKFYSEQQRNKILTTQATQALRKYGVELPRSRDEYRALIDSIDLTDKSTHKLYATLIGLADVMDQVLPTVGSLTKQLERLQSRLANVLADIADRLADSIQANRAAAADWRKVSEDVQSYLTKLRGTASALIDPMQARAFNRAEYLRTLRRAKGGDMEAAGNLTGAAGNYLSSVGDTATSRFEAAWAQARVMAQLGEFATVAETEADKLDRVASLQEKQLNLIEKMRELLASGKSISEEQLETLRDKLGALDKQIQDVNVTGMLDGVSLLPERQMDRLTDALKDLSKAMTLETRRQERAEATRELNAYVSDLTANKAGNHFVDDKDLAKMARIVGLDTEGMTTNQIRNRLANFSGRDLLKGTVYDPTGEKEQAYLDRLNYKPPPKAAEPQWAEGLLGFWQQMYNNPYITVEDVMRASKGGTPLSEVPGAIVEQAEKEAKKKAKKFASGGAHRGGLRVVGEYGEEMEHTGPSRIYSHSQSRQLLRNDEILAELKAMRQELRETKEEQRKLNLSMAENTRKTKDVLERWNVIGLPATAT